MRRLIGAGLCLALLLGDLTPARATDLTGLYIGGNFGRAHDNYDTSFIDNQYTNEARDVGDTLTFTSSSTHRLSNVWWANVGYMYWPYFGIDAAYIHLGQLSHRAAGSLESFFTGTEAITTTMGISSRGPALSLLGRLPLTDSLDLNVRVGDYDGKSVLKTALYVGTQSPNSVTSSSTKQSLLLSVGGSYTFAGHWSVRLDYFRINQAGDSTIGQFSVNMVTAGAAFTF